MPIRAEFRFHYRTPSYLSARARVLRRAKDRCEWCARPNGKWVTVGVRDPLGRWFNEDTGRWVATPVIKVGPHGAVIRRLPAAVVVNPPPERKRARVQLGVAHLDQTPGHDDLSNLAAFCQRCHLLYDGPAHRATARLRRDLRTGQLRLELAA